jgi:hypothetical protein
VTTTGGVVLLVLTGVFLAAALVLLVRSVRRDDALDSCGAMVLVMAAAAPAVAYGGLAASAV